MEHRALGVQDHQTGWYLNQSTNKPPITRNTPHSKHPRDVIFDRRGQSRNWGTSNPRHGPPSKSIRRMKGTAFSALVPLP